MSPPRRGEVRVGVISHRGASLFRLALPPWAGDLALPADDPLLVLRSGAMSRRLAVMIAAAGDREIQGSSSVAPALPRQTVAQLCTGKPQGAGGRRQVSPMALHGFVK